MLSAIVISYNSEKQMEDCLKCLTFCDEIIVVDGGSRDGTLAIARKYTAHAHSRPFDHFSAQKNYALSLATQPWVLSVDTDEIITDKLKEEIQYVTSKSSSDYSAYRIPRKNIILGAHLAYGANKGDAPVRLFHREAAVFEGMIHEKLKVEGRVGTLRHPMIHYSTQTVWDYVDKLDRYTALEAGCLARQNRPFRCLQLAVRPLLRFFQVYVVKQGFRDGFRGLIYAFMNSFYEFIRYVKFWELKRS